jgi:hypothetical protein
MMSVIYASWSYPSIGCLHSVEIAASAAVRAVVRTRSCQDPAESRPRALAGNLNGMLSYLRNDLIVGLFERWETATRALWY